MRVLGATIEDGGTAYAASRDLSGGSPELVKCDRRKCFHVMRYLLNSSVKHDFGKGRQSSFESIRK